MSYTEILTAYEANEIDFMSALEPADCHSIIERHKGAADEREMALFKMPVDLSHNVA